MPGSRGIRAKAPLSDRMKEALDKYFSRSDNNAHILDKPMNCTASLFNVIAIYFPDKQWKELKGTGDYDYLYYKLAATFPRSCKDAEAVAIMTKNRIRNQRKPHTASAKNKLQGSSSGGSWRSATLNDLLSPASASGPSLEEALQTMSTAPAPPHLPAGGPTHRVPAAKPPLRLTLKEEACRLLGAFQQAIIGPANRADLHADFTLVLSVNEAFVRLHQGLLPLSSFRGDGVNRY